MCLQWIAVTILNRTKAIETRTFVSSTINDGGETSVNASADHAYAMIDATITCVHQASIAARRGPDAGGYALWNDINLHTPAEVIYRASGGLGTRSDINDNLPIRNIECRQDRAYI